MTFRTWAIGLVAAWAACFAAGTSWASDLAPSASTGVPTAVWIQRLGADDFQQREHASEQIRQLGLDAFDDLTSAMKHPDTELRVRAEGLRNELLIRRASSHDPPALQRLLEGYCDQDVNTRRERIGQMKVQRTAAACRALCRIARAEPVEVLSKQAALSALEISIAKDDVTDGPIDPQQMLEQLGNSRRDAASWLRKRFSPAGDDSDAWKSTLEAERQTLASGSEATDLDVVNQFTIWLVRYWLHQQHADQVVPFLTEAFQRTGISPPMLTEICESLLEAQAWAAMDQMKQAFDADFQRNYQLLYRYAESWVRRGEGAQGETHAQQAFDLEDRPSTDRFEAARDLESRGMFDWAEREFRRLIDEVGLAAPEGFVASSLLAEMLHDQAQELRAAQVLQDVADAMDRDESMRETIEDSGYISAGSLLSRMHYFYSEHFRIEMDEARQLDHLVKGTRHDPTDADLLIARYRYAAAKEEFRRETEMLIRKAADTFRSTAATYRQQLDRLRLSGESADRELAQQYNQLAWLISNTSGDFQEALAASRKSLELMPDSAGYMDTLARCYYAVGDLPQAIATQQQALRGDPHSGQLQRQLEFFEAERSRSKDGHP
jgi:tetratricopeptide (TPR) repeat protein